jgi:hypothetical protein
MTAERRQAKAVAEQPHWDSLPTDSSQEHANNITQLRNSAASSVLSLARRKTEHRLLLQIRPSQAACCRAAVSVSNTSRVCSAQSSLDISGLIQNPCHFAILNLHRVKYRAYCCVELGHLTWLIRHSISPCTSMTRSKGLFVASGIIA